MKADKRKLQNVQRQLKRFRLNLKSLASLKNRIVHITGRLKPCLYLYQPRKLLKFSPAKRTKMLDEWYRAKYLKVLAHWPAHRIKRLGSTRRPIGLVAQIEAKDFAKVLSAKELEFIEIQRIEGIRKENERQLKPQQEWYAVQARYAIQVEGYTSGLQRYEDRIVLIKALGFRDAEKRLKKGLTQEEVAAKAGLSREYVSMLEAGKNSPTIEVFIRLCRAIGASPGDFIMKLDRAMK